MNVYEEALRILRKKISVRQLVADLHSEDLRKMIERLESVYLEKLEAEQAKAEEVAEKAKALEDIKAQLKELGLSVEDLSGIAGTASADKQKRQYKVREKFTFQYETEAGETKSWTGANVGRKPAEFAAYLERTGKKADECIVE